jgi:hypothetical protein
MVTTVENTLQAIRSTRRQIFARLADTPEDHLNRMTRWGRGPADARYLFLRFSDHEEEHAIQVEHTLRNLLKWQPTKLQMVLGTAEQTRGDLLATLVGLTDDDLDVAPVEPEGEWTLRQILAHLVAVEHSYRINTLYAVEQFRNGRPHGDLPGHNDPTRWLTHNFDELLDELDAARSQTLAEVGGLPDDVLPAPAVWSGISLDVNFRLMRFSHHEREHAAHIRKWRVQTGKHFTDAQRLMGLAWLSHGMLRGYLVGVPDELATNDPGNGEWPVHKNLQHVEEADDFFARMIDAAE